jgi:hypothetical protein
MMKNHLGRLASIRKQTLLVAMALAASLAALSVASPALATPKGEFAIFADCPLATPELSACLLAKAEGGEFTVGKKTVPIKNTITLQGGFTEERETGALTFVGAADGNTLSKTPQTVPGGLLGILAPAFLPKWLQELFNNFINEGITGVTATTELAGPASSIGLNEGNLLSGTGTALSLPLKIKLSNVFLGEECYIGSNSSPVVVDFTTGTTSPPEPNKPIKGNVGKVTTNPEGTILTISENSLVNNSFAAPGANGCGGFLSFLVDPAVNAELGLPAAAGHNTAILTGTLKQASAEAVKAHE